MPWSAPPAAPRCPACQGSVFPAEAFMAADRHPFHQQCVKCAKCRKMLNSATINEHGGKLFCKGCYDTIYMPQDYSVGSYGGVVTPEDKQKKEEEARMKAERAKRERRCPTCDMKAYPDDAVKVSEVFFHKACLKCTPCGRAPDGSTPMMMGPKEQDNVFGQEELEPYCKFCFAKKFKVSALNIAETVMITPVHTGGMGL